VVGIIFGIIFLLLAKRRAICKRIVKEEGQADEEEAHTNEGVEMDTISINSTTPLPIT
jgi:hypothetical protein